MRAALIVLLLLAACAPMGDETVVVPVPTGGLLVLVHDGERVPVPGSADGVVPATGSLWNISEMEVSSNGIQVDADMVEVIGLFDDSIDLTARVPLTKLQINTQLLTGDALIQGADYNLGPDGGTIWLTGIETKAEGGYRIRGQFDGRICPQPDSTEDCHRIEGVFAFDQAELLAGAITGDLITAAQ